MMRYFLVFVLLVALFSCEENSTEFLSYGTYRAELQVSDTEVLPFVFKVKDTNNLEIYNAEEIIKVDEVEYKNDSVYIKAPVFQGYLVAKIESNKLKGSFVKADLNRIVPFAAKKNDTRFDVKNQAKANIAGNWETVFSPDSEDDKYIAKGIFKQKGNEVAGTFRTTTGDYRYLQGVVDGNQLKLSTFDGAHAFLFTATVTDSTINGTFYSGNHWKEPFTAKRNTDYELPSANDLTFLKEGYDTFDFSFPNLNNEIISLSDEQFKDKVVIVQIMGSWCPNCLDESKYYSEYFNNNSNKDLEFVALAFEYVKTKEKAINNLKRLKERVGIKYIMLLAQYGTSDKKKAQEKLPMLNHVLSYPTTIFIDKKGNVRKIHTGFNGPATGEKFNEFKTDFEDFVEVLLRE